MTHPPDNVWLAAAHRRLIAPEPIFNTVMCQLKGFKAVELIIIDLNLIR
jgi:hypothetical protein